MKLLYAINYRVGYREIISPFCFYYFGQLWDGEGDGEELLDSGVIYIHQNGHDYEVSFNVSNREENISDSLVFVTAITEDRRVNMSKYNWHMKYNGANRYWVIVNSDAFKDVGILETSYLINEKEKREYILYDGHITLGHYDTLRGAKQSFALRVTKEVLAMINPDYYIGFRLLDLQEALAVENKITKIVVFVEMEEPELLFDGTIYELYILIGWYILERCVVRARIDGDACYATIDINREGEEF